MVEMNEISKDTQKSMKTRIITGIIMALVGVPCVILGDWFYLIAIFFIVGIGLSEVIKTTGNKYPPLVVVLLYIFTYSFVFWVFFQKDIVNSEGEILMKSCAEYVNGHFVMTDVRISTMGVGFLIAMLFLSSIISQRTDLRDVFYLFTMSLFIGFAGQALLFLRFCPANLSTDYKYSNSFITCLLLIYVLAGAMLNDICAYFVGVLFGKHKMAPIISPKKTWEGFVGGIVLSTVISSAFVFICDACFKIPLLKGIIDLEHWYFVVLLSLCLGLSSVLGDLMFSSIKRSYSIKDFGTVFPGHGGVLDRFDSVMMTTIIASIVITFIYYNPVLGVIH